MTTTDTWQQNAIGSQINRHAAKAIELARHVAEYADYVIRDLQGGGGKGNLPDHYASTMLSDVQEIIRRIALLEGIKDVNAILGAGEEQQ